jgi:hypothetical protein
MVRNSSRYYAQICVIHLAYYFIVYVLFFEAVLMARSLSIYDDVLVCVGWCR